VVPLKTISSQIKQVLNNLNLNVVFIATDASEEGLFCSLIKSDPLVNSFKSTLFKEKDEIKSYLKEFKIVTYQPTSQDLERFKDGGVAIIDQIICSHARYFIGTKDSTFSFRIEESRELMSFHQNSTFNAFCNGKTKPCETSKWLIKY
jgi:peptide-O-fucosyltransferase